MQDSLGLGDRMLALPGGLSGGSPATPPTTGEATPFTKNGFHEMISSDWYQ